jgi:hypothetical protein
MLAPDSFTLPSPLENEAFPPPLPPKYLKHQVYTDPHVFIQVDTHAIKVSQCQHPTFRDLMWDLVYRYELSELERARVIFRWMTSKDMSKMGFVDVQPGSAEDVLQSFHQKRGTLAHIFELMCRFSGIPSATISGYAKGVDYLPGDEFRGKPANHSWNVVYLMGAWQLIDAHWATRYLVTSEKNDGSGDDSGARIVGSDIEQQNAHVVYEYDDFYFIMEPQQAVYSHFPEDSAWQLVTRPLTLEQFELLPLCKSQFFRCGMDFLNQHRGVVSSRNGQVQMALAFHKPGCGFTYKLQYALPHQGSSNKTALELRERVRRPQEGIDVDLRRFLLLETLDNEMHFYCRLPLKGVYYLTVYAQEATASSDTQTMVGTFRAACEYKLLCDANNPHLSAYPSCHDANWGPSRQHMQHYGLTSQWKEGIIELDNAEWQNTGPDGGRTIDVHFYKDQPRAREVRLYSRIRRKEDMDASAEDDERDVQLVRDTVQESIVQIRLPYPGEFGVEIYANDVNLGDGDSYTHVCQYLIHWPMPPNYQPPPPQKGQANGQQVNTNIMSQDHRENTLNRQRDHISPLRGMYDYAQEAPSVGSLPQPYTEKTDQKLGRESPSSAASNSPGEKTRVKLQYSPSGKMPGSVNPTTRQAQSEDLLKQTPKEESLISTHPVISQSSNVAGDVTSPMGQFNVGFDMEFLPPPPTFVVEFTEESEDTETVTIRNSAYSTSTTSTRVTTSNMEDLPPPPSDFNVSWKSSGAPAVQTQGPQQQQQQPARPSVAGTGRYGRPQQTDNAPSSTLTQTGRPDLSQYQKGPGGLASGAKGRGADSQVPSGNIQRSEVTIPVVHYGVVDKSGSHIPASHNFARAPEQYQSTGVRDINKEKVVDIQESRVTQESSGDPQSTLMNYHPEKSSANWRAGPIQREPPKEFAPKPVQETVIKPEESNLPEDVPTVMVTPAETTFKVFNQVDKHAVEISQETQSDFNQLIWQLIYARNITDDLEKIRVTFLWLCTKDLHAMSFHGVQPGSPEEILMGIRTGRSTYAQIFQTLCQYAGVQCKLISGYAKGADYEPGQHFTGQECRHSWNAVLIHGTWQLIDCHWAARRLIGHPGQRSAGQQQSATHRLESIRYELDMFYFLCKPNQLIYTHFPYDADWQLLRHPVSLQEFEALAPVKSNFFKYQLELRSHRMAVIECQEEVMIKIAVPQSLMNDLAFTFSMCRADNSSEEYKKTPLSRYGKQEMMREDCTSTFYIRPPENTSYKLLIYAKQLTPVDETNGSSSTQVMYGAVCEYRLEARFPANFALPPFPPCTNSSYGPFQPTLSRYNVQPHCTIASLRASQGYVELVFYLEADKSGNESGTPPRLMAKLKSSEAQLTEDVLRRCLLLRNVTRKEGKETVLSAFLPRAGEYGLEIYANDPSRDGNSFFQIYQYFLVTESASSAARNMPNLPPGFLGAQEPVCSQLGVAPVNYVDPYIASSSGELVVQMTQTKSPLRLMCQLWYQPGAGQEQQAASAPQDCSQQVLQQVRDRNVYFIIRFPRTGYFKLQLFAAPMDCSPSDSLPCVYNYLLEAGQPSRSPGAFPTQFAHWRENGYLHEPVEGELFRLGQQKRLKFSLEVPHANGVAVVIGDDWVHLTRQSPSGRWESDVELAQHWGQQQTLAVCANYDDASGSYNTLLTYRLS